MIVSLQFHDIVRQQLEHVVEALAPLESELGGSGDASARQAAVLALQCSQLSNARERFASAVAAVEGGLDDVSAAVQRMADQSGAISGPSRSENASVFAEMERGCAEILQGLRAFARVEASKRDGCAGLSGATGRMGECLEEIRRMEAQVHRTALNASIRAAHIGAPGDALGVLAGSMHRLTAESGERSDSLDQSLGRMRAAATELAGGASAPAEVSDAALEQLLQAMRSAVDELHSSGEQSHAMIGGIVERAGSLHAELASARESFQVGEEFAEVVERARGSLAELGRVSGGGQAAADAATTHELASLARNYTMEEERAVHAVLTSGVVAPEPAAVEPAAVEPGVLAGKAGEDEFGDNVEFF